MRWRICYCDRGNTEWVTSITSTDDRIHLKPPIVTQDVEGVNDDNKGGDTECVYDKCQVWLDRNLNASEDIIRVRSNRDVIP
jgi:hypothetical protein